MRTSLRFKWTVYVWFSVGTIDNYAKDGGPEEVLYLCSFYQDPLRS